jgi:transcriptional regulator with XRE-family HTH domain
MTLKYEMNQIINISQVLKSHRKRLGYTQREMAQLFGTTRSKLGSYEEGRARRDIEDIIRMSRRVGYNTVDQFLQLDGRPDHEQSPVAVAYHKLPADKKKIVDFILQLT